MSSLGCTSSSSSRASCQRATATRARSASSRACSARRRASHWEGGVGRAEGGAHSGGDFHANRGGSLPSGEDTKSSCATPIGAVNFRAAKTPDPHAPRQQGQFTSERRRHEILMRHVNRGGSLPSGEDTKSSCATSSLHPERRWRTTSSDARAAAAVTPPDQTVSGETKQEAVSGETKQEAVRGETKKRPSVCNTRRHA